MNEMGLIAAFADLMGSQLSAMNLGWEPVFFILHFAFFTIHYLFAGQTAHIGALYAAFLAMMLAAGGWLGGRGPGRGGLGRTLAAGGGLGTGVGEAADVGCRWADEEGMERGAGRACQPY
jgi:di/tricarboxylate transporter